MFEINQSFIRRFEENVNCVNNELSPLCGTQTLTEAREERDQDRSNNSFICGTQTGTRIREESDQDKSVVNFLMGTGTHTDAREESDSDRSSYNSYDVFLPINVNNTRA